MKGIRRSIPRVPACHRELPCVRPVWTRAGEVGTARPAEGFPRLAFFAKLEVSCGTSLHDRTGGGPLMRIRSLMSAAVLVGGLAATATPAVAAPVATPAQVSACSLTVTDLYYSIGMQTAFA